MTTSASTRPGDDRPGRALSRRDLLKAGVFATAAAGLPLQRVLRAASAFDSRMAASKLPRPFTRPFVVPPVATPVRRDATTDVYRLVMQPVQTEIVPGFTTTMFGYAGSVPGPTIRVERDRRAVVRHVNALPQRHPTLGYEMWTSVHLHGSPSLPQYDGYASDITRPGQFKDYVHDNRMPARTLWYHDHGVHHTAENAYHGLAGFYLADDARNRSLPLPRGEYDVPLLLSDAVFRANGELLFTLEDESGLWGDVILVNGVPWPAMPVKRRKYRFRLVVASVSRSYELFLDSGDPFTVVGTDAGLMPAPQTVTRMRVCSGERYELVIDFAKYRPGTRIVLRNTSPKNNRDYPNTDRVMAFDVVDGAFDTADNAVPDVLDPTAPAMTWNERDAVRTRQVRFHRQNGEWKVNESTWRDVEASGFTYALAKPKRGDLEIWEFQNNSGGWFHPVHLHLVDFRILSRNGKPPFAFERGPKDVVYLGENETVRALVKFDGLGRYMIHCHNLLHEDHDMMTQFEVVADGAVGDDPMGAPARPTTAEGPL